MSDSKRIWASTVARAGSVIQVFVSRQPVPDVTWRKASEPATGVTVEVTP